MNYKEYKQKLKEEFDEYKEKLKVQLDKYKEKQKNKLEIFKNKINKKNKTKPKRKNKGGTKSVDDILDTLTDDQKLILLQFYLQYAAPTIYEYDTQIQQSGENIERAIIQKSSDQSSGTPLNITVSDIINYITNRNNTKTHQRVLVIKSLDEKFQENLKSYDEKIKIKHREMMSASKLPTYSYNLTSGTMPKQPKERELDNKQIDNQANFITRLGLNKTIKLFQLYVELFKRYNTRNVLEAKKFIKEITDLLKSSNFKRRELENINLDNIIAYLRQQFNNGQSIGTSPYTKENFDDHFESLQTKETELPDFKNKALVEIKREYTERESIQQNIE